MARPREFDTELAVERAMDLFRKEGYHATPLLRLTAHLGIGSGSLYAAFGSKEGLYAEALKRYDDGLLANVAAELDSAADIRTALRSLLLTLVTADVADPERGCLLVNAATERAGHGATVTQVGSAMAALESILTAALERACTRGELTSTQNPAQLARFLTTFIQGLHVMANARADRPFLESAISTALKALD
jgi:TetR/AcrR family transcriptional repressor of nem operon